MQEELPPVLDDDDLFASAHETHIAGLIKLDDEPLSVPDDDFDDEEENVRYKKVFVGAPMWVVTFGDLMSLLLTFFVLILSFSSMDPVKFKLVRGSLDKALGIQKKISAKHIPRADNMMATEFNRRDFNKKVKSILQLALRDTFPPGQEPGRVEKVQDIRGEVVRFVAYDLFLPGSEKPSPKAKMVYQAMADTLIRLGTRLEVRGIALEAFAKDERKKNSGLQDGVSAIRVAGRRAVIGAKGVRGLPKTGILAQHVLPGVTPGLTQPAPDGVVNLTEFVFLVPDAAQQRALKP
ncbi:MAG: hypothetical protein OSB21_05270 [Myxococcota bacterium]|nr:hypothetical protein [Myxococcota bacterium]